MQLMMRGKMENNMNKIIEKINRNIKKKKIVCFSLDLFLFDKFKDKCKEHRVKQSKVIMEFIKDFLSN